MKRPTDIKHVIMFSKTIWIVVNWYSCDGYGTEWVEQRRVWKEEMKIMRKWRQEDGKPFCGRILNSQPTRAGWRLGPTEEGTCWKSVTSNLRRFQSEDEGGRGPDHQMNVRDQPWDKDGKICMESSSSLWFIWQHLLSEICKKFKRAKRENEHVHSVHYTFFNLW